MQEKSWPGDPLFPDALSSIGLRRLIWRERIILMKNNTSLVLDALFRLVLLAGYAFMMVQIGGFHLSLIVILSVLCIIAAQGCSDVITAAEKSRKARAKA